ncbi:MAG: CRISPR-associated endonuclease Cas2 [Cyanobacteria bacterium J069]|nr:MAG: CRISPR-associated endonuclease Cas2 [Cyanobacteria bacterium J069]
MLTLIVYDIPDNRRRLKLSNLLEGYGRRVQKSVFECFLTQAQMERLYQQVAARLDPAEDNVRFYWIPPKAMTKTLTLGSPKPEPPPSAYIF